jgi:ubiquinone/menaquinone biosynthesis C-methylase UbiE
MTDVKTDTPPYDGYHKYTGSVAANYESDRQLEAHWWKEDNFIREFFRDKIVPSLLDTPVGTGRFFKHYTGASIVVGVDVSEDMLSEARLKLSLLPSATNGSVERGDILSLRFNDRQFSVAVVWRLLHLIPVGLLPRAIGELCRVTDRELLLQTYSVLSTHNSTTRRSPLRTVLGHGRRLARRLVRGRADSAPRSGSIGTPQPADEISSARDRPWNHIQAAYHSQELIDSLFAKHGFAVAFAKRLDSYDNCDVRVTVYQR